MLASSSTIQGQMYSATRATDTNPDEGMQDFVLDQARVREGEEMTVLQFVRQEREKAERRGLRFLSKALRNELYYLGEQFKDVSEHTLEVEDIDWQDEVPQVYRNYLRPLINTFSSRLQKDRPDAKAYGANPSYFSVNGADVANALIYHVHRMNDLDDKIYSSTPLAQCHGKVGYKTVWDPEAGRPGPPVEEIDEETGDVVLYEGDKEGEVTWSVETVFDYWTDGHVVEEASYVCFCDYVEADEARAMLEDADIFEEPETTQYSDLFDEANEGTEILEFWHKPTKMMPDGWYAVIVGGHVTEYMEEYPYEHEELPLSEWFIDQRRNSAFGSSHVDDAVVIQRQINELVSVIHKLTRDCGQLYFIGHPSVIEAMDAGGNYNIAIANERQRTNNGWIDPPNPPPLLFAQLENLIKVLYDVFGLNEILTGQDNVPSGSSARQVAYLTELDSMKLAGTARSLTAAIKRAWRQTLKLYQQFVKEERLLAVAGPTGVSGVMAFLGSDIDGVDIDLEPDAGINRTHAADGEQAEMDMMNQLIPPDAGMEMRDTGQDAQTAQYWQAAIVSEQIKAAMAGAQVQPDPNVDPGMAVDLIQQSVAVAKRQPVNSMLVNNMQQLAMGYQQVQQQMMMQQQQMQQQQMQAQQPPQQGAFQ